MGIVMDSRTIAAWPSGGTYGIGEPVVASEIPTSGGTVINDPTATCTHRASIGSTGPPRQAGWPAEIWGELPGIAT